MRTSEAWWALPLWIAACSHHPPASRVASAETCDGAAIDVEHHAIELEVRLAPAALEGKGEILVRTRRATRTLSLDTQGVRVSRAALHGRALHFAHSHDRVCIELPQPSAAGEQLTLALGWTIDPAAKGLHVTDDQIWAGYRAAAWMPTLQDPAQRATLELHIVAPRGLRVAASGRGLGHAPLGDDRERHDFSVRRPSPPFLYAFAVGHFDEAGLAADGVSLRALGPRGADLAGALALTAPMLRFFSERLAAPLPAAEYMQVFVHGDAAQEAAGMALLAEDALADVAKDPSDDWLFSHELSHQWFAWLVPCADFADLWLNEGFASFLSAAAKERRWGRQAYDHEVELWRERSRDVHERGLDAPLSLSDPPSEAELQPRGVTYARGALVLDKLRAELGDDVFWRSLQHYVKARAEKGARSEDLRASFEAVSGRDLNAFFERWVYAPAPDL